MPITAEVPAASPASEKRFAAVLQHRFFLRAHMAAILTGTLLVGLLVTRILFTLHLNVFAVRYGLAVLVAYAAFVGFVKVWLWYVEWCTTRSRGGDTWFDGLNFCSSGSSSTSTSSSSASLRSGGGRFGGGGASGGWDESSQTTPKVAAVTAAGIRPTPSKSSGSSSSSSSSSSGGDLDLGELILILLIIALVVAILASFAWLVYAAPGILGETAFNAALAGALTRHAHKATHGEWVGSVMRKTAFPFLLILALSITLGWYAQHYCPHALRLRDALHCVK